MKLIKSLISRILKSLKKDDFDIYHAIVKDLGKPVFMGKFLHNMCLEHTVSNETKRVICQVCERDRLSSEDLVQICENDPLIIKDIKYLRETLKYNHIHWDMFFLELRWHLNE